MAPFDGNKSRVREQSSSETTAAAEGDVADDDKIHGDFKGGPDPMSVETEPEIDSSGCPKWVSNRAAFVQERLSP